MKLSKIFLVLVAVALVSAVFVVPAFAQGVNPPSADSVQDSVFQIVQALFELVVALFVIGIGSERGTQLIKVFWNLLSEKLYPSVNLKDSRAFILAGVVAFFITFYFGVDMTQFLKLFDAFDPELLKSINAMLVFFASTRIHESGITSNKTGAAG